MEERYQGLASLSWADSEGDYEVEAVSKGEEIPTTILNRGCFTTDDKGRTLIINGLNQADLLSGLLNHAWKAWVRPELERFKADGVALPDQVNSILFKQEHDKMRMELNATPGIGHMVKRPGMSINKGDRLTSDMILDIVDVTPPTYKDRPTAYFYLSFNGEQVSIVFDMRPVSQAFSNEWSIEDKIWYGNALAEQILASVYGHVIVKQQSLIQTNIPFSLGLPSQKMCRVIEASREGIHSADKCLHDELSEEDWRPIIGNWMKSELWQKRMPIFEEILMAYEAGLFSACVVLLLPQIEGTIMEYLVNKGKGLTRTGYQKKWFDCDDKPSVMKDLQEDLESRNFGYIRHAVVYCLLDFLRNSSLYGRFSWQEGGELLGRHPILHGFETAFGKKENADRLLMVLDSVFWLVGVKIHGEQRGR